jgi:glucose-1-phosphate thymidylyltransferase
MKLVILAAGYATRLYPLTLNRPKPLLVVAGRPMIEHVLAAALPIGEIDAVYVVTNAKFAGQFASWAATWRASRPGLGLRILNDGSTDESNKRGAIGDLHFVLTQERLDEDLVVVAGDNLFSAPLVGFGEACRRRDVPRVGLYDVGTPEAARRYNAVTLDADGRIVHFVEKAAQPSGTLIAVALYFYPRRSLPRIHEYIAGGHNPDQPGRLIQWLHTRESVFTWRVPGLWFDIGSKESLEEADRVFASSSGLASSGTPPPADRA